MSTTVDAPQSEREKVESWRFQVLLEANYPRPLAEQLARSDADLHRAAELPLMGCSHETAVKILL